MGLIIQSSDFNGAIFVQFGYRGNNSRWPSNLLSNGPIGVDFGRIVGIPTPARVETIVKKVDLEADCMPNE